MMKCVSVIVPVYNKRLYLEECLDSLLHQTRNDFEIICIDDCSDDGSWDVLVKYSERDERIKLLRNMHNMGAGESRNRAIEIASGEYLMVLDADNLYEKDMVEKVYLKCKEDKLDVLHYYVKYYDDKTHNEYLVGDSCSYVKGKVNCILNRKDRIPFVMFMSVGPYTTCARMQFVRNNKIKFLNLSNNNDAYYLKSLYILAERLEICDYSFCKNRINIGKQLSANIGEIPINISKTRDELERLIIDTGMYSELIKSLNTYWATQFIGCMDALISKGEETLFEDAKRIVTSFFDKRSGKEFNNLYQEAVLKDILKIRTIDEYKMNYYDYCLKLEERKTSEWKKLIEKQNMPLAIWGYGKYGKYAKEAFEKIGIVVESIIDVNYTRITDVKAIPPSEISERERVIVVLNSLIYNGIIDMVNDINDKCCVFDFMSCFTFGFDIYDCMSINGARELK